MLINFIKEMLKNELSSTKFGIATLNILSFTWSKELEELNIPLVEII